MKRKSLELSGKVSVVFSRFKTLPNLFRVRVFRVAGLVVLITVFLIMGYFLGARFSTNKSSDGVVDSASTIKQSLNLIKKTTIDKTFTIPGSDKDGKTKGDIKISVVRVEKNNKVKIGDKLFDTTKDAGFDGKLWLLVFIDADNQTTDQLSYKLVDIFRLVDTKGKLRTPDLSNMFVDVFPLSVKSDQIAFLVDANQSNFKIQAGEPSGEKQTIEFSFPN